MKKYIYGLIFLVFAGISSAGEISDSCPQFLPGGNPLYTMNPGDQEICHINYAVIHKCSVKAPVAVFEHLTPESMSGKVKRRDDFRPDPKVFKECQAQLSDYAGNPYDRGHMSPAANNSQSTEIMSESFFLSNMVPQNPNNNRGAWRIVESWERDWAKAGGDFYIVSGGIYDSGHAVIGNGLGVPTRLFKIIYERTSGNTMIYIMPNSPIAIADIAKYQTTIEVLERESGIQYPFIPRSR